MTLPTWLTFLLGSLTVILTFLVFWIYLFLLMLVFVLHWLLFHWEILIMLRSQFPLTFRQTQNRIPHNNLRGLHDHLGDLPCVDIFKVTANAAASGFCEWVQVEIDVYIPHHKYQVKSHSSPRFSATCAAAIVDRDHFSLFVPTE